MHASTRSAGRWIIRAAGVLLLLATARTACAQADSCAAADPVPPGIYRGSTSGSRADGSSTCGSTAQSPDVWFRVDADRDCVLVASTCGSEFDTVLSIHTACGGEETEAVCSDDVCDLQSTAGVFAEEGASYFIRIAGFSGARGDYVLEISCEDPPERGADLVVADLSKLEQVGRQGDEVALSLESMLCNAGGVPVDWFALPDPRHPFLVFNAYRLLGGRLEQIGQSWVKHGSTASQQPGCEGRCVTFSEATSLGPACSDIYPVAVNAAQYHMGPRTEVDPWTGTFVFEGSHFDLEGQHTHDPLEHRLRVRDADLDPALHPGARWFVELIVTSHDDEDHENGIGWEEFSVQGLDGTRWHLSLEEGPARAGSVLDAWSGASRTTVPAATIGDGRSYLAAKAVGLGDGLWRYEYAIQNLDMARAVRSFHVPLPPGAAISAIGFHAVPSHGEGFSNEPWEAFRDAAGITWATPAEGAGASNPLRWGTTYSFRFESDVAPAEVTAVLECWRPGDPPAYAAATVGPEGVAQPPRFRRGDVDASGQVELTDAIVLLGYLFLGSRQPPCTDAADSDDNGRLEISDAIGALSWLFTGGPPPADPGPLRCGPDPTPGPDAASCEYDPKRC